MKNLFKHDKRGNWVDIFEYSIGAVVLGIVFIITGFLLTQFYTTLTVDTNITDTNALTAASGAKDNFPASADYIIPIIFIFVLGFSVWSARKIQSSHLFAVIGVFVLLMLVFFAMMVENLWNEFITHAILAGEVSKWFFTNIFLSNMRYFVLAYGFLVGVALYAKTE